MNFPWLSRRKYKIAHSSTKEYVAWYHMLVRCYEPSCEAYPNYGGRGITVCDRWLGENGVDNFCIDMGLAPSDDHSIDRIDNSLGYSPENCRWATPKEQARNRRSSKMITIANETKSMVEWCEIYNVNYLLIRDRILDGWDPLTALTTPKKRVRLNEGDIFNSWTVLYKDESGKYNRNNYVCRCVCGNEVSVAAYDLLHNKSTQCRNCGYGHNKNVWIKTIETVTL